MNTVELNPRYRNFDRIVIDACVFMSQPSVNQDAIYTYLVGCDWMDKRFMVPRGVSIELYKQSGRPKRADGFGDRRYKRGTVSQKSLRRLAEFVMGYDLVLPNSAQNENYYDAMDDIGSLEPRLSTADKEIIYDGSMLARDGHSVCVFTRDRALHRTGVRMQTMGGYPSVYYAYDSPFLLK